ncbi:MAG: c-type cytochrome [Thioalkalivibrio sp.]|nr:c-type cytochrome [Thioalkalivibrio sp.]
MVKPTALAMALGVALMGATSFNIAADRAQMEGEHLFAFHACINCHGAQGNEPISRLVPKLAGKNADELLTNAMKILRGQTDSEEAKLMKSAVAYSQTCDAPPTEAEFKKITDWLATL